MSDDRDIDAAALLEQRRRFVLGICRGIDASLSLAALPASQLLAELDGRIASLAKGAVLVLVERPGGGDGPRLRATLARRFTHVAVVQQRALSGSVLAGERHAASRILPLAEPVRTPAICLLHLASEIELPAMAPVFLEADGVAEAITMQADAVFARLPALAAPGSEGAARRRAVGLLERLVTLDRRAFVQSGEIALLRRTLDETPPTDTRPHPIFPRAVHAWPLVEDRHAIPGFYDHRVDDAAVREGDAGAFFLERHSLLSGTPDFHGALAALNAARRPRSAAKPDVSIIIPVHGQLGYTLNCLDSLFALDARASAEIIVVDDASTDATTAVIGRMRGVALLRHATNRGFIASCNAGASQARGHHVVFLNNDTRVVTGWLDTLLASFAMFPDAGLVGSKMLYADGTLQEAGGIIWRDGSCWNDGRNDDPNRPQYCYARQVDYISGCSIMLPTALFHSLAGFDTHYTPAYCEDADLAMRVRQAGREVWFQPQSRIIHYEGRTSGTDTAKGVKAYQVVNSRKLFLRWHRELATHRANGSMPMLERERKIIRRALIVDATAPTPLQDAGSVTTTLTLRLFQRIGYKAHFVPQDNFLFQPRHSTDLMAAGIEVAYAPYDSDFETYMRRNGASFDVVLVYRVTVLEQVLDTIRRFAPQAPILFHNMDLHYLRMERQAVLARDAESLAAAASMKARELALIARVDCTITHSTHERDLLAQAVPNAPVVVWPFMFEFQGTKAGFAERRDFCFLGGYGHAPNVDAVTFFVRDVLPLIHLDEPDARFIIAGANPTPAVLALAGPYVEVTGQIDDLRKVFDRARVFACSLRIGAGTKGKVSTAMAYGIPVVSTSCGAEGMELAEGSEYLLADDAASFAAACLRAYRDPELWQSLSANGQDLVRRKHSLAMGERVLEAAIETAFRHHLRLPSERYDLAAMVEEAAVVGG